MTAKASRVTDGEAFPWDFEEDNLFQEKFQKSKENEIVLTSSVSTDDGRWRPEEYSWSVEMNGMNHSKVAEREN